jgi:hypothetical protein
MPLMTGGGGGRVSRTKTGPALGGGRGVAARGSAVTAGSWCGFYALGGGQGYGGSAFAWALTWGNAVDCERCLAEDGRNLVCTCQYSEMACWPACEQFLGLFGAPRRSRAT